MLVLSVILIFLAFIFLGISFSKRNEGISLHDQQLKIKNEKIVVNKQKNYFIGGVIGLIGGFTITGNMLLTLIAGIVSTFIIGGKIHQNKADARMDILNEQYTQVLNSIISSLQAGSNPYQALEEVTPTLKSPAKDIFIEILRKNRTGINYHEAIKIVADESGWTDLKQLEMAFRLYDKTGSNLVAVCSYLLKSAYENRADKKYVDGITSQIRMTAIVLSIIPFFLMAVMRFMSPEYAEPLFNQPLGIFIVILAFVFVAAGNKIINGMVKAIFG